MIDRGEVERAVAASIEGSDIFVVEVKISASNDIEVVLESPQGVGIDDCARVSREVEAALDRDREDFALTVASAGVGEPFLVEGQYRKALGKQVVVATRDGRRRQGALAEVGPQGITLARKAARPTAKALKALPPDERERVKAQDETLESIAWDDIKSTIEHINFQ